MDGAAAGEASKYEETELILRDVVALFSDRADIKTVQEAGHATAELKSLCDARHKEMQQSIRGEPPSCPAFSPVVALC